MNKIRKFLFLALILVLSLALIACGGSSSGGNNNDSGESQSYDSTESGSQGGNEGGSQGGNEGGDQGGNEGGDQGGNEGGDQGGNEGGDQGGNEGGDQGGNEGGDQGGDKPETDYGKVYVKLYFSANGVIEKTFTLDEDGMTLNEVFEEIKKDDSLTYAGEYTLNEFAVYNAGEQITDQTTVFTDGGNYLSIIAKDAISTEMIMIKYTGVDHSGVPIDGEFILNDGITSFMEVTYQMNLYPSFDSYYFTVYGEKVGGIGEDGYIKYDYNSVMIFASTEITVHPIYDVRVSMDGSELSARFEKAPTLEEVIKAIGLEDERDDYLWTVNGYVTQEYQSSIGYLGESIRAEKKKIGVYAHYFDENGMEINLQPTGYYLEKNSATVKELLDFYGLSQLEGYTWEVEYKDVNNETVRIPASDDHVITYVYDANAWSEFYEIHLYGKTSAFTLNLWSNIIGVGEKYMTLPCREAITVAQILNALEITVDFEDLHVMVDVGGSGYEVSSPDEVILVSATVNVYDRREYVTVNVKVNGSWVNKQILLKGLTTVGQAITAAGFNYSDYSWTITRQGSNLYNETTPVTSENEAIQNYDVIKGQVLESINVFFSGAMDYGFIETETGSGYKTYESTGTWDNPVIQFNQQDVFELLGWSLTESKVGDTQKPALITSLDQLFALNLQEVTVYPVIEINKQAFNGLYYFSWKGLYLKIENGYANGFYFDNMGNNAFSQQFANKQVTFEYEYSQFYVNIDGDRINVDVYQKQEGSFIYIENRESAEITYTIVNYASQLQGYLQNAQSYKIVDVEGNEVTVDQIQAGQIYYAYVNSQVTE